MTWKAEEIVCRWLRAALAPLTPGSPIEVVDGLPADFLLALEHLIEDLLVDAPPLALREGLDGFMFALARNVGPEEAEFIGLCRLITDQSMTPLHLRVRVSPDTDTLEWVDCRVGEAGSGKGGMAAEPAYGLALVAERVESISWAYTITRGAPEERLHRALQELRQHPGNGDAAFNLFVTAWSLIDWLHPGDSAARERLRAANVILQACAQLAEGSEQLGLDNPENKSVTGPPGGGDPGEIPLRLSPGHRPASRQALFVALEGDAAAEFGSFPSALNLAEKVVRWIDEYVANRNVPAV